MRSSKKIKPDQIILHAILIVLALAVLIPFVIIISASLSDDNLIISEGYSLLPRGFSLEAYRYIFTNWGEIGRAYLVTISVTVIGVTLSLFMTNTAGYVLSRDDLPGGRILTFIVIFTMLFNGGLIPTYYVYSVLLKVKDTFLALLLPNLLLNAFNVLLVRNYYRFSLPKEIIEAARIDGAGEFGLYFRICFPLSMPISATISIMTAIAYWNDWQNALYYLTGTKWNTIQQLLRLMNSNLSYLMNAGGMQGVDRILPTNTIRMAIALVVALPILIVYPFFQKYVKKGITFGAVKE